MSKIRLKTGLGPLITGSHLNPTDAASSIVLDLFFFYAAAPDASDDQIERLSVFSEAELTYKMTSAETELTLTPNRENGKVNRTKVELLCRVPASFCKF